MLRFSDEIDLRTSRPMKKTTLNSILHIPFKDEEFNISKFIPGI